MTLHFKFDTVERANQAFTNAGWLVNGWNCEGEFYANNFVAKRVYVPILSEPDEDGVRTVLGYESGIHINVAPNGSYNISGFTELEHIFPSTPIEVFF